MKIIISKKFTLVMLLAALFNPFVSFAEDKTEGAVDIKNVSKVVDYVDNTQGRVVLDDFVYILKINTKIYDAQKKLVNRYALREGQRVIIEVSDDRSENNLDSIYILGK
jgi:hypothetical protein